jgi:hypothetical protein
MVELSDLYVCVWRLFLGIFKDILDSIFHFSGTQTVFSTKMSTIVLGSWPLEIVIRWGKPYLSRLDEYPRKQKYPAM